MHVSDLPDKSQDHLKAIYDLQEWGTGTATLGQIAERLGQRTSTTSEAIKRLAAKGLVEHTPYSDVRLSEDGRALALQMVRRHRLIETYLFRELGYHLDELHDEAEELEHAVSDRFVDRIEAIMGTPTRDPHGDPIPDSSGALNVPDVFSLADATSGGLCYIDRISDRDPDLLRYLQSRGVLPGATVEVMERPYPELAEIKILKESADYEPPSEPDSPAGKPTSKRKNVEGEKVQLPVSSLEAVLCREVNHG